MSEINLIGGFYKSKTLPWSAQDVVNWLPVKSLSGGTRSPYKLRGAPGLAGMNPPISVVAELSIAGNAPDTTVGASYSYSYTAEGGTPAYTFILQSGTLPAGLSLSSAGAITGTPTTSELASFTVRVIDSGGRFADVADTINVAAAAGQVQTFSGNTSAVFNFRATLPAGAAVGDIVVFFTGAESGESTNFQPTLTPIGPVVGAYASASDGRFFGGWVTLDADSVANGLEFELVRNTGLPSVAKAGAYAAILIKGSYAASPFTLQSAGPGGFADPDPPSIAPGFTSSSIIKAAFLIGGNSRSITAYPLANGNTVGNGGDSIVGVCYEIAPFSNPVEYTPFTVGGSTGTYRAVSVVVRL